MRRREFMKTMTAAGTGLLLQAGSNIALGADQPKPDPEVKRVLVMFKCHFDAGFIDTQANVVRKYFTEYFPRAIEVARQANAGGQRRYVWTTGSWLLYEDLEQASAADRKTMEEAIARGDIAWHALPFTWQTEMMSQSLMEGSLGLSRDLDRRFGKTTTGGEDDGRAGAHARAGCAAGQARRGVPGDWRERRIDGGEAAAVVSL